MQTNAKRAVVAAMFALVPLQGVAQEERLCDDRAIERARVVGEASVGNRCLLLGGGMLGGESEFLSEDLSTGFPVVYLTYGPFYWDTNAIGYYLLGSESADAYWGIAASLELPENGFSVEDEEHLANLEDRDPTLEGGVTFVGGGSWGNVELRARADLEGEHDGFSAYAIYDFPIPVGNLTVSPNVFVTYRDEDNGDYYYGVDEEEALGTDRAVYEVDEPIVSPGFGYSMTYAFDSRWSLFHSLRVRLLDGRIDDSPLTVKEEPGTLSFGVLYRVF